MTRRQPAPARRSLSMLVLIAIGSWGTSLVFRAFDGSITGAVQWMLLAAGVLSVSASLWALVAVVRGRLDGRWMAGRIDESSAVSHETLPHLSANPDEFAPVHRPTRHGG